MNLEISAKYYKPQYIKSAPVSSENLLQLPDIDGECICKLVISGIPRNHVICADWAKMTSIMSTAIHWFWVPIPYSMQNMPRFLMILPGHYGDVIMGAMAFQITSLTSVYSTVHSGADQRKHQSSASLAFVRWIRRWPVKSPHKWPVTRKMFPFDEVIMTGWVIYAIYNVCKWCTTVNTFDHCGPGCAT